MTSPDSANTSVSPQLALIKIQTAIILSTYRVRVHARIGRETWARLWYLCRALDREGAGHLTLPLAVIQTFLNCNDKSVYRWLQQGKKRGAFRYYKVRTGVVTVYLGSMFSVCYRMNLKHWGGVEECELWKVLDLSQLRSRITGIVTQRFQQKSRYAADRQLKPQYRKLYGTAHPNELVGDERQSSHKSPVGEVPCVLHISSSRIFVSKRFIHYGTSQNAISCELGIHTRTVRRHQEKLGMTRRQLCQHKYEYHQISQAWENEATEWRAWGSDGTESKVGYQVTGNAMVYDRPKVIAFSDGVTPGAKKQQPNTYQVKAADFGNRFFRVGKQVFINRCNIYREELKLKTMSAARRKYHYQLSQCQLSEKTSRRGRQPDFKGAAN
ncbi:MULTISPECIES: hypothetical protein [unclassified Anabaena]|uniref:hypothetical protein n=1 Tax=unclassified Anabaena TaxID=2619674 RepID=UPI00082EED8B|nr:MULTISPECIES: hypothetical protein [unclassified Anabaena]